MERHGDETHLNSTEASGGVKNHNVRYVLMFSLALAIALLSLIWMTGSWLSGDDANEPSRVQRAVEETA